MTEVITAALTVSIKGVIVAACAVVAYWGFFAPKGDA